MRNQNNRDPLRVAEFRQFQTKFSPVLRRRDVAFAVATPYLFNGVGMFFFTHFFPDQRFHHIDGVDDETTEVMLLFL